MQKIFKPTMKNSNKILAACLLLMTITSACAGEATSFVPPYLIGFEDAGKVYGLYSSTDGKVSCSFLFFQKSKEIPFDKDKRFSISDISTFIPGEKSFAYDNRNTDFDIDGHLYKRDEYWIVRTFRPQAGCGNAQGIFEFDPPEIEAERYQVSETFPALGIRLVKNKSFFYDLRNGKFIARKGYLTKWDGVVLLKVSTDGFSYVRYVDAGPKHDGRVTFGWVHTSDLVDPFPPSTK